MDPPPNLPDICRDPKWLNYWKNAGLLEAVCHTHAIEQAVVRNLQTTLEKNQKNPEKADDEVPRLVQHLVEMGHSLQAIDKFVQDGGFGPVSIYLPSENTLVQK